MNLATSLPSDIVPILPHTLASGFVERIVSLWGRQCTVGNVLGHWENLVFAVEVAGSPGVLRLIKHDAKSIPAIEAECEFISLLARHGIKVARPIRSLSNAYVEAVRDGEHHYHAVLFERLFGVRLSSETIHTEGEAAIHEWGSIMGRMHGISASHPLTHLACERWLWTDDPFIDRQLQTEAEIGRIAREDLERAWAWLGGLDQEPGTFGLIHADLHGRNFLLHEDRLGVFDFDDLQSHFFAYDLAVAISWACPQRGPRRDLFSRRFLSGYREHFTLPEQWIGRLGKFIRLRMLIDYIFALSRQKMAASMPDLAHRSAWLLDNLTKEEAFET